VAIQRLRRESSKLNLIKDYCNFPLSGGQEAQFEKRGKKANRGIKDGLRLKSGGEWHPGRKDSIFLGKEKVRGKVQVSLTTEGKVTKWLGPDRNNRLD